MLIIKTNDMKLILSILIMISLNVKTQTLLNWKYIKNNKSGIEFMFPENSQFIDTLSTSFYSSIIDSNQVLQVHIYQEADFNSTEKIFNEALFQENYDTLRAVVKLFLLTSNSKLTQLNEYNKNGYKYIEIGVIYDNVDDNNPIHSFISFYAIRNKFAIFSWTGKQTSLSKGLLIKDKFFNSIKL